MLLELGSVTQFTSVVSGTQGDYDPSKTKVLHFSMNPASLAKQQRKEEQQQLQEECERLRELVRVLEAGGSVHGNLEGVGSFQSPQEVAGRLLASRHEDLLIFIARGTDCQGRWRRCRLCACWGGCEENEEKWGCCRRCVVAVQWQVGTEGRW